MGLSKGFTGSGKKSNGRIEDGTYGARIQGLVDLGLQKTEWKGETKENYKVFITFEFPTERVEVEGVSRPRWLSKEYTISTHEKSALYGLLKAADPDGKATNKGRHVKGLLGLPVMVEVGSTESGNAKVVNVIKPMKGMAVGELENPTTFFDLDKIDFKVWEKLPTWLQDKIKGGVDFDASILSAAAIEDIQEDNPF